MPSRRPSSNTDGEDTNFRKTLLDGDGHQDTQSLTRSHESSYQGGEDPGNTNKTTTSTTITSTSLALSHTASIKKKVSASSKKLGKEKMEEARHYQRPRRRSLWRISAVTLIVTMLTVVVMVAVVYSFRTKQCDTKGCRMTYMSPGYAPLVNFDTEHTRFATKYKTCLYREREYDKSSLDPKGIPVMFIPGNAGSYKQVRSVAKEAARQWAEIARGQDAIANTGMRKLDFFTVDFNEDITAFHGQTLLDQAEYLNDAVAYVLSLYHDARKSTPDTDLPDPSSVIIVGHSMGGIVARTMLTMQNYQPGSVNTIITLSTPHARAPVSFDEQIVSTYAHINDYWRKAFSQKSPHQNPLWNTTLISIAGGGLDTVVPSDYADVSSIVPESHGFTAFSSTIPNVWVGIDHLAILWCRQLMTALVKSLLDVVDDRRPGQTKSREERMRMFKKRFLTGMEDTAEKTLLKSGPTALLSLTDHPDSIIPQGVRLTLRELGITGKPEVFLIPIPSASEIGLSRFSLLTDQNLNNGKLEVLLCSIFLSYAGQSEEDFSQKLDFTSGGDGTGTTKLACKSMAGDVIYLPASRKDSKHPFEEVDPFTYLQYDINDFSENQYVAIIDKSTSSTKGFAIAEFVDKNSQRIQANMSLSRLVADGIQVTFPAHRALVQETRIPALHSSLLAWKFSLKRSQTCENGHDELFAPMLRQYLSDPYESKYFVNVKDVEINLHGTAPFMPQHLKRAEARKREGLSLQFWSDPICGAQIDVTLKLDIWGSLGKLVMRYRTIFAAFPVMIVALVLRLQFKEYDARGRFMGFSEGLDTLCVRSLPILLVMFSALSTYLTLSNSFSFSLFNRSSETTPKSEYVKNDLFIGLQDPFFWFLAPLFSAIALGTVALVNYAITIVLHILMWLYSLMTNIATWRHDERKQATVALVASSPRRRVIVCLILLFFVAFVVPYQFAYLVACIVQLMTCVRALRVAYENSSNQGSTNYNHPLNFYHYTHTLLLLMLWILPINLPVLVVWIHNLAVHWLTPFSSHHNLISILPFILLVEMLTTGRMIPRVQSRLRVVTEGALLALAVYAAVWGVSRAYGLHGWVCACVAWWVGVHFVGVTRSGGGVVGGEGGSSGGGVGSGSGEGGW